MANGANFHTNENVLRHNTWGENYCYHVYMYEQRTRVNYTHAFTNTIGLGNYIDKNKTRISSSIVQLCNYHLFGEWCKNNVIVVAILSFYQTMNTSLSRTWNPPPLTLIKNHASKTNSFIRSIKLYVKVKLVK